MIPATQEITMKCCSNMRVMDLLIIVLLKTKSNMKKKWKTVLLYIVRIIELLISGAAGGMLGGNL
ncbi:hypothetical protein K260102G11_32620 [Bacteroides uniformis]